MNQLLKAALEHLAGGRSVLPLKEKKPTVKWKPFQSRLATEAEAKDWFKNASPKMQIAMILGRISGGLWVLDADGPTAVQWLEKNAPSTNVYALTRRGRHAYYRMPDGVEIRNTVNIVPELKNLFGDQVDVKGEAGYAIIPPSPHSEGFYEWEIAGQGWNELPQWRPPTKETEPQKPAAGNGNLNLDLTGIREHGEYRHAGEGERNSLLASYAGELLARGLSASEVETWALGWNFGNSPPLPNDEVRRTVESIVKAHVRNHGYQPPASVIAGAAPSKAEPNETNDAPLQILHPGGVLELVMNYIRDSSVTDYPLFSLGVALTLIGTLMGQKIMTETGLRTNLYFFVLASSGTGKNAPLLAIPRLLAHCGVDGAYLGPTSLASTGALLMEMHNRQGFLLNGRLKPKGMLLFLDEFGDFMGAAKNKNNTAKNELLSVLKELFSKTEGHFCKMFADKSKDFTIHNPHLSIYATGTGRQFWANFTTNETTDGFLARAIILHFDLEIKKKRKIISFQPSEHLTKAITRLADLPTNNAGGNLNLAPAPRLVSKTEEADQLFMQWEDKFLAVQNQHRNDDTASIYNRMAEHAHKIALIHAVSLAGDIPAAVDINSVEYALAFVDWLIAHMDKETKENISHGEADGLRKRILRKIKKSGIVTNVEIYKNLHRCSAAQAKDALEVLKKAGEIIELEGGQWTCPQEENKP